MAAGRQCVPCKAHLVEVSVTVRPQILKDMCAEKDIHVLE